MEHKSQEWRQYIIACMGGFSMLIAGYGSGWTSPINIKLANPEESPLPDLITVEQEAWIGSLLTIGGVFGPFIGGAAAGKLGRCWGMRISCIPLLVSWCLIALSWNLAMLYAARIFAGLYVGMTYTLCPMYLGEIATNDRRGAVCASTGVFLSSGFLLVYSIGPYASYEAVAYVAIALSLFYVAICFVIPESPYYYLAKDDIESARQCLMKIRGKSSEGVQAELDKMTANDNKDPLVKPRLTDVFRGNSLKALFICCAVITVQQMVGINAVMFYMTNIFEAAGTNLDAAISTIIIGVVQLLVSPVTPLITDRMGRRVLLLGSCAGMAVAHVFLGLYFRLDEGDYPIVSSIGFIPLTALILYIASNMCGVGPVPMAYIAEVLPVEVKASAMPIVVSTSWIMSFLVTRFFGPISQSVGMGASFWIFGGICALSFIFIWFFVPETKGKSFQEIQEMLKKKTLS